MRLVACVCVCVCRWRELLVYIATGARAPTKRREGACEECVHGKRGIAYCRERGRVRRPPGGRSTRRNATNLLLDQLSHSVPIRNQSL